MADKNFLKRSLTALLGIIEGSTAEKQPSEAVLKTFTQLLQLRDAPTATSLKLHEKIHADLNDRLRRMETFLSLQQKPKVRSLQTFTGTLGEEA